MTKKFYLDLLERTAWTFVQGFGASWLVSGDLNLTDLKLGAVAGVVAVIKGLVASRIHDEDSASTVDLK